MVELLILGNVAATKDGIRTVKSTREEQLKKLAAVMSKNCLFFNKSIPSQTADLKSSNRLWLSVCIFRVRYASASLGGDGGLSRAYAQKNVSTPLNTAVTIPKAMERTDPTWSFPSPLFERVSSAPLMGISEGSNSDEITPPVLNAANDTLKAVAISFGGNHLFAKVAGKVHKIPVASPHNNRPSITHT